MVTVPTWLGATSGVAGASGQINQFLGTHVDQFLYAGTLKASQATNGSAHVGTNSLWLAQSFVTAAGQTTIGYVTIPLNSFTSSGSVLGPITLGIYANSGGAPTGLPLVSVVSTTEYGYVGSGNGASDNVSLVFPLPITGLSAATTYWLVAQAAGGSTPHYTWRQSNQTSGASTSPTGSVWTAQTYGFQYNIFDQTVSGNLTAIWEDSGARWTAFTYTGADLISTIAEYTVAQGSLQYVQSYRTLSYTSNMLTGAA